MSIIVIIALLLSGGVSYAAEGSVPGEALYVIKTEVNEPLKGALAVSEKAQANLEARLATERLEEAEVLAARGTLHAEVSTTLSERFAAHAERVGERIEALEEKDAAAAVELSSEFEASLRAHEHILSRLDATSATVDVVISPLLGSISAHALANKEQRERAEIKVGATVRVRASAEGKQKAAAHKIEEVRSFLEKHKANMSAQTQADAKLKLATAEQTYAEGDAKLEAEAYGEAFNAFQHSLRDAQEAKMYAEFAAEVEGEHADRDEASEHRSGTSTTETEVEIESEEEIEIELDEHPEVDARGNSKVRLDLGL